MECINIILANNSEYPDTLFQCIEKMSDCHYLQADENTLYVRIYILTVLSTNKRVINIYINLEYSVFFEF